MSINEPRTNELLAERRFVLSSGLEAVPATAYRYFPVYLTLLSIPAEQMGLLLSLGHFVRLFTLPASHKLSQWRLASGLGNLVLGAGMLLLWLVGDFWALCLAVILISVGNQMAATANLAVLLNTSPTHRRELTSRSLALTSLHRNLSGQVIFDWISSFGMPKIWLAGACSAFAVSIFRASNALDAQANMTASSRKQALWSRGLGPLALFGCLSGLFALQDIWLTRRLSQNHMSFLWFFLPYFLTSSLLRFGFGRQLAKRGEVSSIAASAFAYSVGLVSLAWQQTPLSVALSAMAMAVAAAVATPVVMVWISDCFPQGAATIMQVVGTLFSAGFALWFGMSRGEGWSSPPIGSLACLLASIVWVMVVRPKPHPTVSMLSNSV